MFYIIKRIPFDMYVKLRFHLRGEGLWLLWRFYSNTSSSASFASLTSVYVSSILSAVSVTVSVTSFISSTMFSYAFVTSSCSLSASSVMRSVHPTKRIAEIESSAMSESSDFFMGGGGEVYFFCSNSFLKSPSKLFKKFLISSTSLSVIPFLRTLFMSGMSGFSCSLPFSPFGEETMSVSVVFLQYWQFSSSRHSVFDEARMFIPLRLYFFLQWGHSISLRTCLTTSIKS